MFLFFEMSVFTRAKFYAFAKTRFTFGVYLNRSRFYEKKDKS